MLDWSSLANGLLHLVAPLRCAACDLPLLEAASRAAFCGGCEPLLDRPSGALRPPNPGAAAFVYGGPLADAMKRLKYGRRPELAARLGGLLVPVAEGYLGQFDCVVPLPLHPSRLRERGFNQAALLAKPLSRALGVPLVVDALVRLRATPPQASLPRDQRRANVREAFALRRRLPPRVLLFDDVRTTGSSLAAAAEVLQRSGCREVRTLALACAVG